MRRLLEHRFKILLLVTLGVLAAFPVILDLVEEDNPGASADVMFVLTSPVLLAGTLVVSDRRRTLVVALCLLVPMLLFGGVTRFAEPGKWIVLQHVFRLVFLAFVMVVLLRYLFRPGKVNFDTISASMCVYLLLGVFWENVFSAMETLRHGSFVQTVQPPGQRPQPVSDTRRSLEMLYFSFATLTTLGYGDIVPTTATARMFAVTEAMMGQGYLLIMVSRLVGMYGTQAFVPPASLEALVTDARCSHSIKGPQKLTSEIQQGEG
jgi:hypothetical protein